MKFLSAFAAVVGYLAASPVSAESLPDPTRPYMAPAQGEVVPAKAPAGPVLQSIMIGPDRKSAIISGQLVTVGQSVGDAKVRKITDTEVTLVRGGEVQVLRLFGVLEKKESAANRITKQTIVQPMTMQPMIMQPKTTRTE